MKSRICQLCGEIYTENPAISILDNKTLICHNCAIRQGQIPVYLNKEEQNILLDRIEQLLDEFEEEGFNNDAE